MYAYKYKRPETNSIKIASPSEIPQQKYAFPATRFSAASAEGSYECSNFEPRKILLPRETFAIFLAASRLVIELRSKRSRRGAPVLKAMGSTSVSQHTQLRLSLFLPYCFLPRLVLCFSFSLACVKFLQTEDEEGRLAARDENARPLLHVETLRNRGVADYLIRERLERKKCREKESGNNGEAVSIQNGGEK